MADPDPPPTEPAPNAPPPEAGPRPATPLLWIVLLLALLALGWFLYNRFFAVAIAPEPPALPAPSGSTADLPREPASARADEDGAARRPARDRPPHAAAPADRAAEPVARVQPDYPAAAYRARAEGTVLVGVLVDARGQPREVEVVRRSGSRELDRAAVDAVRQWTFSPAMRDGRTVEARVEIPVTFRLERQ
ncbi:MAG: energy transducer TonB [Gammaproteobacteria bacterium]|nr:energy transducer TonB [Gammaproteobacteria bacterium]